jgi:NAD(P) transhydrogenase subunit alpha
MKVAVLRERRKCERRVAATPESVRKLAALGLDVAVEAGAGDGAHFADAAYREAGATIAPDARTALHGAGIVLVVQRPEPGEVGHIDKHAMLVGLLDPLAHPHDAKAYAAGGITAFALELVPRISRAQSMDVLSSQSSLAGYRAVIDAAAEFGRAFPLMMTAAGTIAPARVFVLGAGVAGLQAIATAKRLGAVVSATDVRAAAAEQVQSLGAAFVAPPSAPDAEAAGGYASELDDEMKRLQAEIITETLKKQDIAICTALIPGKQAPILIENYMLEGMKPGSVIVDLAAEQGGNCTLSRPGEIVEAHGVRILGHRNVPSRVAVDASAQYARNIVAFLAPLVKDGALSIDWNDEIVNATLITRGGTVVHPRLAGQ